MIYKSWATKFDGNSLKRLTGFDLNWDPRKSAVGMVTEGTGTTGISNREWVLETDLAGAITTPAAHPRVQKHSYYKDNDYTQEYV